MFERSTRLVTSFVCLALLMTPFAAAQSPGVTTELASCSPTPAALIIENVGQWDPAARFQVWGGQGITWLAQDAIWISLLEPATDEQVDDALAARQPEQRPQAGASRPSVNLRLSFVGANTHAKIEPYGESETVVSYFRGNDPDEWHADVPVWTGVRYVDLYPGLDLEISGTSGSWSWRMVVRDGVVRQGPTSLRAMRLRVEGADAIGVEDGRLKLETALGGLEVALPAITGPQAAGLAEASIVEGNEVLCPFSGSPKADAANAPADAPEQLTYSTYLGGAGWDLGYGIAVDGAGCAYVTGVTESSDFPASVGPGYDRTLAIRDAFVVKLNAQGTGLVYATFLGGRNALIDEGYVIAVDDNQCAYITGKADSSDFPTTPGAYDTTANGGGDSFITKLSASGTSLVYSTFVGGSDWDGGDGIAVDVVGNTYIAGHTRSSDFPTGPGSLDRSLNGYMDGYIFKLNSTGTTVLYSTYLGGSGGDWARALVLGTSGTIYVAGWTSSADFPTTSSALFPFYRGGGDLFITELNAAGNAIVYSTFLGSTGFEAGEGMGLSLDSSKCVYITGLTDGMDFPTTSQAFDRSYNGDGDVFITKINPSGSALVYSTYLGGRSTDLGRGLAIDGAGNACVLGYTGSSDFPTTANAYDTSLSGAYDAFLVRLSATGASLSYGTVLGGSGAESASDGRRCIALDRTGAALVTGATWSKNFPTTTGAYDRVYGGNCDAFVSRLLMAGTGQPTVWFEATPPLSAPGSTVPLNWGISGGVACSETFVRWDTIDRGMNGQYRYSTPSQHSDSMTHFYDYVDVPIDAKSVYIQAYAVIDGNVFLSQPYHVKMVRAMDVGSAIADVAADGTRWYPEQTVENGLSYYQVGGDVRATNHPIAGTTDDWLYRTAREGIEQFYCWFGVGAASLTVDVEFHLAELDAYKTAGQRVFNILLEPGTPNEVTIGNVDVCQAVGHDNAYIVTGTVTVLDYALDVVFEPVAGDPILNGIKLRGLYGVGQRQQIVSVGGFEDDTYVIGMENWRHAQQLVLGGAGQYHAGLRFPFVQIPRGSRINGATLWVRPAETTYAPLDVTIYAEAVDNGTAFDTYELVPDRPRTGNGVSWHISAYTQWLEGQDVDSPQLSRIIQEVVNRRGWQAPSALNLLIVADPGSAPGMRSIWAIDGSYEQRARLVINYTPKSATWGTQAVLPLILR